MPLSLDETTRLDLCYDSLAGLSTGDALGAQYFTIGPRSADLARGIVPPAPWPWTDDSEMAFSIVAELRDHRAIDADRLATAFAERCEPYRGYGPGAVTILHAIRTGTPWRDAARAAFGGAGSLGNGAAMRAAPIGAYFAGEPDRAAAEAITSAEVTHAHAEGIAGAVVVAVAASFAAAAAGTGVRPAHGELFDAIEPYLVNGAVERGIRSARRLAGVTSVAEAAYVLGNGGGATAHDTVPFAIWVAARSLTDYPAAITACVEAGGDVDTTAAIAGGIVAAYTGTAKRDGTGRESGTGQSDQRAGGRGVPVPASWLLAREPLPAWAVRER